MLPVAKGIPTAVRQIVVYSFVVVAVTFTLPLVTDEVGVGLRRDRGGARRAVHRAGDSPGARHHAGAGHTVVHLLEHLPRAPLRRRCRRHPPPLRLTIPLRVGRAGPGGSSPASRWRSCWRWAPSRGSRWPAATTTARAASTVEQSDVRAGGPRAGDVAPDFTAQTLDGKTVSLSDFRGKPVVLNFWASWCNPCRKEFPLFRQQLAAHKGEFVDAGRRLPRHRLGCPHVRQGATRRLADGRRQFERDREGVRHHGRARRPSSSGPTAPSPSASTPTSRTPPTSAPRWPRSPTPRRREGPTAVPPRGVTPVSSCRLGPGAQPLDCTDG